MKTKILFFSAILFTCGALWAQTGYGGSVFPGTTSGTLGNDTNSYYGDQSGAVNTATDNTFIGHQSGLLNILGFQNTFLGSRSGSANTDGLQNTFLGYESGYTNSLGGQNTFLGAHSGYLATGSGNVFLGHRAGYNETGSDLLYIDNSDTTDPLIWGDFTANILRFNGGVSIADIPQDNSITQILVTDKDGNISWRDDFTISQNSFPSFPASAGDGGGQTNAYMGHESGINSTAIHNTFTGYQSGLANTAGANNSFTGSRSGFANTNGNNNTYVGVRSGYNAQGSGNVFLGHHAGYDEAGSNLLYIDNSNTTAPLIWGDFANNMLRFNAGVSIAGIPQDDSLNQVLVADNNGNISWRDALSLDNDDTDVDPQNEIQDLSLSGDILSLSGDGTTVSLTPYLDDTVRSDEDIRDASGAMVSGNTETLINVTYDDTSDLINFEVENDLSLYDNSTSAFITDPTDPDADPVNELQNLSYDPATRVISIDQGGSSADLSSLNNFPSFPYSAGDGGGDTNAYFGREAGLNNTAANNTFTGHQSGYSNTMGANNTANGYQAMHGNTTAERNVAVGTRALYSQSYNNGGGVWQSNNVAVGFEALYSNQPTTNTNGRYNNAVGYQALRSNTTGSWNAAQGTSALFSNTSGNNNTATGYQALYANTTGSWNAAGGVYALYGNTVGANNTASGAFALSENVSGSGNTAVGRDALYINTIGNNNTALGYNASPIGINYSNTTALGHSATPTASNQVRIGNAAVNSIGGYVAWSNLSDGRFKKNIQEDIPGLEFITQLRPVSYDLDRPAIMAFLDKEETQEQSSPATEEHPDRRSIGFVAQEVEQLLTENGYTPIGIETPQNEQDHYSIRYAEFVVPLVKAVQELSDRDQNQQDVIAEQQQLIEAMQQELETLKNQVYGTTGSGTPTKDLSIEANGSIPGGFALYQNTPNPFNINTSIQAQLPESVQHAKIIVYNLQGLELETYDINQRGKVSVEISAGRFPSGIYLYALIADDRVIDTRKMILTK